MTLATNRRWFAFSLRTMFVVVAALGCWLGNLAHHVREQKAAIAAVESVGGSVYYEYMFNSDGNYVCDTEPPGPHQLWVILDRDYFFDVVQVIIADTESPATNETMREVSRLGSLRNLHVQSPKINDGGLRHLTMLEHLKELPLVNTPVSQRGVAEFKQARPSVFVYVQYDDRNDTP